MNKLFLKIYRPLIKIGLLVAAFVCGGQAHELRDEAAGNGTAIAFGILGAACVIAFALIEINDKRTV